MVWENTVKLLIVQCRGFVSLIGIGADRGWAPPTPLIGIAVQFGAAWFPKARRSQKRLAVAFAVEMTASSVPVAAL